MLVGLWNFCGTAAKNQEARDCARRLYLFIFLAVCLNSLGLKKRYAFILIWRERIKQKKREGEEMVGVSLILFYFLAFFLLLD